MKTTVLAGIAIVAGTLTAGHILAKAKTAAQGTLEVTSGMFHNGDTLPTEMTCDGNGITPMLTWAGAPESTKSFAIEVRDLDAKDGKFAHWIVTGIPKNVSAIGSVPPGAVAGLNSNGGNDWAPPCPPAGQTHRYQFTVFALDKNITNRDFTLDKLDNAIDGHVVASGDIVGKYTRLGNTPNPSNDVQP